MVSIGLCSRQATPSPSLDSERYKAKASAEAGIASVQVHAALDVRYERKSSSNGKEYSNLKASNGQVIGASQMYPADTARDAGIASMKENGVTQTNKDNS